MGLPCTWQATFLSLVSNYLSLTFGNLIIMFSLLPFTGSSYLEYFGPHECECLFVSPCLETFQLLLLQINILSLSFSLCLLGFSGCICCFPKHPKNPIGFLHSFSFSSSFCSLDCIISKDLSSSSLVLSSWLSCSWSSLEFLSAPIVFFISMIYIFLWFLCWSSHFVHTLFYSFAELSAYSCSLLKYFKWIILNSLSEIFFRSPFF